MPAGKFIGNAKSSERLAVRRPLQRIDLYTFYALGLYDSVQEAGRIKNTIKTDILPVGTQRGEYIVLYIESVEQWIVQHGHAVVDRVSRKGNQVCLYPGGLNTGDIVLDLQLLVSGQRDKITAVIGGSDLNKQDQITVYHHFPHADLFYTLT